VYHELGRSHPAEFGCVFDKPAHGGWTRSDERTVAGQRGQRVSRTGANHFAPHTMQTKYHGGFRADFSMRSTPDSQFEVLQSRPGRPGPASLRLLPTRIEVIVEVPAVDTDRAAACPDAMDNEFSLGDHGVDTGGRHLEHLGHVAHRQQPGLLVGCLSLGWLVHGPVRLLNGPNKTSLITCWNTRFAVLNAGSVRAI